MAHGTQQIKSEKRGREVETGAFGLTRRRFLTFLGAGSAALAAGSAGVFTKEAQARMATAPRWAPAANGDGEALFFTPIEPTDEDELVLPEGYSYTVIAKWGDNVPGTDRKFGYNNDYVAFIPIDALDGGHSSEDGLLAVNHEYPDPKWVSEYRDPDNETEKTPEQILLEKQSVGVSVFRVRREDGEWTTVDDADYGRMIDATTPMDVTGPVSGSDEFGGATEVIGTLANCGGGLTPWYTVLTCEENFQDYYGAETPKAATTPSDDESAADGEGEEEEVEELNLADTYRWLDDPDNAQPPEAYGWVVEIDPFDPESKPRKHSWLGRVRHENAAITFSKDNHVVVYTGHDQEDESIYKFVSSGTYAEGDREANLELLTDGMLYVANFADGEWVALDYANNPVFKENDFKSQADVLLRTFEAAKLVPEDGSNPIGTPLDRCEDIEVDPTNGQVYAALTNNAKHGNFYGQVIRITEEDDDAAATSFRYEVFAAGGPNTGFASPDNLVFDNANNLWIVTDISSSRLNDGIYETFKNNGAFVLPSVADDERGDAYQFASGPAESELTGPFFTPDNSTLFLAIQHPGEETEDVSEPTSTWPDGDIPRPAVVAITGFPAEMPATGADVPLMPAAGNGARSGR